LKHQLEEKEKEEEKEEKKEEEKGGNLDEIWKTHLFPHGEFVELAKGRLWEIEGSLPKNAIKRNMAVYKMKSGGLFLHSVVALNEEGMKKLESLGKPEIILVPNGQHTFDCAIYKKKYPEAKLITPKSFQEDVSKKKNVKFDGIAQDIPKDTGITVLIPEGTKMKGAFGLGGELAYEVEIEGGRALLFCDLLGNQVGNKGLSKALFGNQLGCARIVRWFALKDKNKFKQWLLKLTELENLKILCVCHGRPIMEDVNQALKAAIARSF